MNYCLSPKKDNLTEPTNICANYADILVGSLVFASVTASSVHHKEHGNKAL